MVRAFKRRTAAQQGVTVKPIRLTELVRKYDIEREPSLANQLKNVHEYQQAMRAVDQAQTLSLQQKNKSVALGVELTDQKIVSQELDHQIKHIHKNLFSKNSN
ncbi:MULTISPECIES: hypothetical protein [unclassified Lactobacillus]|uniref:hypothetical protein n=1 Tax=unclassified Lactobacillus TaxID=2620435 RepID=UPI000EFA6E73|nr:MULTISPECIES: hypothetical protein [unclassified Lactobacillus]RMC26035.1 hypothetical protein F5ESL0247_00560 [Lactobacillus sp. ESL0247]RMC29728.1 hypothetical protein F5ESL0246_00560 [Lactobacillus sp. ESL0246]RMC34133.1 hypothetical protein F5ESL0245_00560 [Lactobacillus sp. ESL0245]